MTAVRSIYQYQDYKAFVRDWVASQSKSGRGQWRQMASHLRTTTVSVSQIFSGSRDLSAEQALELSDFLSLSEIESRFFLSLVARERAGTARLKKHIDVSLQQMRAEAREIKSLMKAETELSEEVKAVFYADWIYSAVRIACSIENYRDVDQIAAALQLSRSRVNRILQFLKLHGLILQKGTGFEVAARSTHLEASSPLSKSRHMSWRVKAMDFMDANSDSESLFFTAPCSLSRADFEEFKEDLRALIARFTKRVKQSQCQTLACLNIDWFRFDKETGPLMTPKTKE